jgi:hypothetical protein
MIGLEPLWPFSFSLIFSKPEGAAGDVSAHPIRQQSAVAVLSQANPTPSIALGLIQK